MNYFCYLPVILAFHSIWVNYYDTEWAKLIDSDHVLCEPNNKCNFQLFFQSDQWQLLKLQCFLKPFCLPDRNCPDPKSNTDRSGFLRALLRWENQVYELLDIQILNAHYHLKYISILISVRKFKLKHNFTHRHKITSFLIFYHSSPRCTYCYGRVD